MEKLILTRPATVNGELVKEIEYDLDGLTGADISAAVRSLKATGVQVGTLELDPDYHAALFAQAAGISLEEVKALPAKDYTKASTTVRDFFLGNTEE